MLRKYIHSKTTLAFLFTALVCLQSFAQDWDIPANKKSKNSYFPFTKETIEDGEGLFLKNCQSCHGNLGKDNSLKSLKPTPPDLAGAKTQERTDGDLFYIITTGRLIMPSFKTIIAEEDRWDLVSYIRSLNKKYIQVLSKNDPSKSKLVVVKMSFDSLSYKLRVDVKANEKEGVIALKDAEVFLFAERYFGRLQIDSTHHTNNDGVAFFSFPKDLPGDKNGNINLVVTVGDEVYGEIEAAKSLKIGVPTDKPSLTEKRAIWNTVTKAPIWLMLTYTLILLGVGAFLLYIVFSLMKIKKLGKE